MYTHGYEIGGVHTQTASIVSPISFLIINATTYVPCHLNCNALFAWSKADRLSRPSEKSIAILLQSVSVLNRFVRCSTVLLVSESVHLCKSMICSRWPQVFLLFVFLHADLKRFSEISTVFHFVLGVELLRIHSHYYSRNRHCSPKCHCRISDAMAESSCEKVSIDQSSNVTIATQMDIMRANYFSARVCLCLWGCVCVPV